MTLRDLHRLALRYCPPGARWESLLGSAEHWGPAHEIGHTLAATQRERRLRDYGVVGGVNEERAVAFELAAMHIGAHLLTVVGRPDLIARERRHTPDLALMEARYADAARRLLRRRGLERLPRTAKGLERLLGRRVT